MPKPKLSLVKTKPTKRPSKVYPFKLIKWDEIDYVVRRLTQVNHDGVRWVHS